MAENSIALARSRKARRRRKYLYLAIAPIIPVIVLASVPLILFDLYTSTDEYQEKKRQKQDAKDAKPPKVMRRKRALSFSGHSSTGKIAHEQRQSRLCTLPAELRLQIYQEVVGVKEGIHVAFIEGVLHAYRCQSPRYPNVVAELHPKCFCYCRDNQKTLVSSLNGYKPHVGVSGLLKSCRMT